MITRLAPTARHHVAALVAVLALLGQTLFPHVHAWQRPLGASHAGGERPACRVECPTALAAPAAPDDAGHDADRHAAGCPVCRAQNDARSSVLPPTSVVSAPASAGTHVVVATVASSFDAVRTLAAPRAPPAAS